MRPFHVVAPAVLALSAWLSAAAAHATGLPTTALSALSSEVRVGDVVFIRIDGKPFREVADATRSWTNHVGVVVDVSGREPMVAESRVPWASRTTLSKFVGRSEAGRVSITRLSDGLTATQQTALAEAAGRRLGVRYDTGFNLHSRGQFCSRYVREVLLEATGTEVGQVETFAHLLARRPDANVGFWKLWYFGRIPWQRETVTPASLLESPAMRPVFDGFAVEPAHPAEST